ncbi:MAG: glycosyltransferase [Acidimicrobiia bacterium]
MTSRARILHLITVYNGRRFVPRCIESALHLDAPDFDLDILVLDDASPEPGWSQELEAFCAERGVGYYCTPRNLGIPRNVSLGLLAAVEGGYTHAVISNSDVMYASNAMSMLLRTVESDPTIGSATAVSNNVSIYSIPNTDPDAHLADQGVVDWIGATLAGNYGGHAIDAPAGISFSMIIPTPVIHAVGTMDPVYGRGYCEETDWSLRSKAAGYRITLAPGAFVYHEGGGSNQEAGLVMAGHTTVPANERIIDMRYPLFRSEVNAFAASGILDELKESAQRVILREAGRQYGYTIHVGWLSRVTDAEVVKVMVDPGGGRPAVAVSFKGFTDSIPPGDDVAAAIRDYFGVEPSGLDLFASGPHSQHLRERFPDLVTGRTVGYPERV